MRRSLVLFMVLLASSAAADCPPAPDISAKMDDLIAAARAAPDERAAQPAAAGMWREWTRAPDDWAQELLDEGMERRASFDLPGAAIAFEQLVKYCPDYAEGYNQRAFVRFLQGDYAAALPDLDRALALRPRHVAALSGKGLTLIALGQVAEGQAAIRAALAFNPWLSERRFLELDRGGAQREL